MLHAGKRPNGEDKVRGYADGNVHMRKQYARTWLGVLVRACAVRDLSAWDVHVRALQGASV